MTDNEIIKALESCAASDCSECPFSSICNIGKNFCLDLLPKMALGLINRQRAEIEELKELSAKRFDDFATEYDTNIQSEAIKEFAKRLKEKTGSYDTCGIIIDYVSVVNIDNLVKEMEEKENA